MRALGTGVAGFIGSQVSESLLDDGWDVRGVDSFSDYYETWIKQRNLAVSQENPRFSFVHGDLAEIAAEPLVDDVDYVFHLAARAGVRSSWGASFDQYLRDNLLATQRLLEACKGREVKKLIFASSSSVYGDAEAFPITETVKPLPISPYGLTKLAGENLCRLYGRSHQVASVSLRFFTVYGPRQRPDMAFHVFGRALHDKTPIEIFGDGRQSREFTYVGDVVRAVRLAAERAEPGSVYNIGGGGEVSLNEAVRMLMDISRTDVPVRFGESQAGDARRTVADTSRALQDLGFKPEIALREGLEKEWEWLQGLFESAPSLK